MRNLNTLILPLFILLIIIKTSHQQYFRQEWLEPNVSMFCMQKRQLTTLFSTKINKYDIELNRLNSAIILNLRFNATQARKVKNECKFTISAEKFDSKSGIYVNIMKMNLRKYKHSERCIDSLQIKYNNNIKQSICGSISNGKITSYEDLSGKVKITLSIDSSAVFPKDEDFIEFQLIATAFKKCSNDFEGEFNCKPNNIKSCIDKRFVNDSIVNCIEPNCLDEPSSGCASSSIFVTDLNDDSTSSENIIQIFLSAITSLILTMLTCGALIWIIYKIKRCLSPIPQTTTTAIRPQRRRRRHNTEVVSTSQDASPSAPPSFDKDDLPPSYSELFPEQSARKNDAENV
ncbi:uncharacterized protein [Chironomus tepperi]|uniref:uncharacterized protein n=1 Tax=Chironomus tepperi TaxID=113505 RepID=UPI00391F6B78